MKGYVIALDQGTTSSRAMIFDEKGQIVSSAHRTLKQHYPKPGWVEHDPMQILSSQYEALAEAFHKSRLKKSDILGIGIANQRETTIIWDKYTGKPVCNAVVWQCRRTAEICNQISAAGLSKYIKDHTGLVIDAYFSASKIRWILDEIPGARARAERGELLFGTVDSWLIWNLSAGAAHVSDYSNASRTMLFDIDKLEWDVLLCKTLNIPDCLLPQPVAQSQEYGRVAAGIKGLEMLAGIPVCGCIGDQQAALFGQACFTAGMTKNTYGTGCFMLMNTGANSIRSDSGLLSSAGWSLGGKITYVLEGSVFNGGSAVQWLRDELGIIKRASECDELAASVEDNGGVYMVSSFTGLGAPYWDMDARGSILGLTRGATKAHICRAALEGIAYQTADLMYAMEDIAGSDLSELRVDGGACVSDIMMQFQADLLRIDVNRPLNTETTASGAAYMAGLSVGLWSGLSDLAGIRKTQKVFSPQRDEKEMEIYFDAWHQALKRTAWKF